jgi:hypothetical protein
MLSVGVKVTEYSVESLSDTAGSVAPVVQENVPATLADPPVSSESERAWPYMMEEAVGATEIVVVSLFTVSVTVVVVVL